VNDEEDSVYGDGDLEELGGNGPIDSKKLKETIKKLNDKLAGNPDDKKLKKAVKKMESDYLPRLEKYEDYEKKLNGRNSFSKTDIDATFMRMKEDSMTRQTKPAYNVQIGTENQFIVGFSIHQRPGDTSCLISHLKGLKSMLGRLPSNIVSDSGYGSEENYEYIANEGLGNFVKYNTFHKEQTNKFKNDAFKIENWPYDKAQDIFTCPCGRLLRYHKTENYTTDNGYSTTRDYYQCEDCSGCACREKCTKSTGNRIIQVSFRLRDLKENARDNLNSDAGIFLRSRRGVDVESVFGHIKANRSFRRFMLRGLEKVKVEWGLLSIAHNMLKKSVLKPLAGSISKVLNFPLHNLIDFQQKQLAFFI
jgi:hypothetical protein